MQLFTLGLNHHTAPLAIREKVVFHAQNLEAALTDLVTQSQVKEAAILSTCNRTELYCNTEEPVEAVNWLSRYHRVSAQSIKPYLYTLPQKEAVKHAFRVASGLDSMVLGEPQILGQLKQAVKTAEHAGTMGTLLHKLFQRTFSVAKEVRSTTEIGACSISMAAASLRLAQRIFNTISEQNVLFIGAGEMIELCAEHFAAFRPRHITVANRTVERAALLAQRFNGSAISLAELPDSLASYDIIITSTASTLPIIGKGMIERAIKARKHRPMFMVDLAVPRDIEEEVGELDDIFLYSIDDLGEIVKEGLGNRQLAAAEAEAIIDTSVEHFMHWMQSREVVPTIRALRDTAERYRRQEVLKAQRLLTRGEDPQQVLQTLSHALTNKLLHQPNHALNTASGEDRLQLEALLRRLYKLHHD